MDPRKLGRLRVGEFCGKSISDSAQQLSLGPRLHGRESYYYLKKISITPASVIRSRKSEHSRE